MTRDELDQAYARSIDAALREAGALAPLLEERPSLPAAVRESLLLAQELVGALPEGLRAYYLERMPRMFVDQRLCVGDAARALLLLRIDPARAPGLHAALEAACALLREEGLDPVAVLGGASAGALLTARPTALLLAAGAQLSSGLPLLGAYPHEREVTAVALAHGDAHQILDLRLSGHLVHELCHGRARELRGAPPPWLVAEAAAIHLGGTAFPRHVFPARAGEAVPGIALFFLAGEGLARLHTRRALWSVLADPASFAAAFGPRAACALWTAGHQDFLRRQEPPFARDALDAVEWLKLADAARPHQPRCALASAISGLALPANLADGAAPEAHAAAAVAAVSLASARALPDLLALARATPWSALPWWREAATEEDAAMALRALRPLFQENAVAGQFETRPSEAPGAELSLDVEACLVSARPRPAGVHGEPARWIWPPPLCRALHERGARSVRLVAARRQTADALAAALLSLSRGEGALPGMVVLDGDAAAGESHEPARPGGNSGPIASSGSDAAKSVATAAAAAGEVFTQVALAARPQLREAALHAAHELGLFAALRERPGSAEELARSLGLAPLRLRALLDVLALEGLLVREGARFCCEALPAQAARPPAAGWGRLAEVIRENRALSGAGVTGAAAPADPAAREELRRFHAYLRDAGAAAARETAALLAEAGGGGDLLELGAGSGVYAQAYLERCPAARATLVDRADVLALARAALAPLGSRASFAPADLLRDELPRGAQVALFANVLHLFRADDCARLVARAAAALAPGGTLCVKDLRIAPDRSGPPASVLFALNMALYTEGGTVHDTAALEGLLRDAGLARVRSVPLSSGEAVAVLGFRADAP